MPRDSLWSYAKTISPFIASRFRFLDSDCNTELRQNRVISKKKNNNSSNEDDDMEINQLLSAEPAKAPKSAAKKTLRKDQVPESNAPLAGQKRPVAAIEDEDPDRTIRGDEKGAAPTKEQPPLKRPRTEPEISLSLTLVPEGTQDPGEYCLDHPEVTESLERARAAGIYTGPGANVVVKYDPPEGRGAIPPPPDRIFRREKYTPGSVPFHILVETGQVVPRDTASQTTNLSDQPSELEEQQATAGNGFDGQTAAAQTRLYSVTVSSKMTGTPAEYTNDGQTPAGMPGMNYPHVVYFPGRRQQEREPPNSSSSGSGSYSSREEFGKRIGKRRLKEAFPKRRVFRRMRTWAGRARAVDIRRVSTGSILTPGPVLTRPGRRTLRITIAQGTSPGASSSSSDAVIATQDIPLPSIENGSGRQGTGVTAPAPALASAPAPAPATEGVRERPQRQAAKKADATRRELLASSTRASSAKKSKTAAAAAQAEVIPETIPEEEEEEIEDDGDESGDYSEDSEKASKPPARSTRAASRKMPAPKRASKAPSKAAAKPAAKKAAAKPAKKASAKPVAKKAASTATKRGKK